MHDQIDDDNNIMGPIMVVALITILTNNLNHKKTKNDARKIAVFFSLKQQRKFSLAKEIFVFSVEIFSTTQ